MLALLAILLLAAWCVLLWAWRDTLRRHWREPVLRHPVLVIESDDWGPGPPLHAKRLEAIADLLSRHTDAAGCPALMTLGVVLAVPDGTAMRAEDMRVYRRIELDDPRCTVVRAAMEEGVRAGVFALQLHGMEHYWPPALLRAARDDASLRDWFTSAEFPAYESLPSALQSRWVDGAQLPTGRLDAASIADAVREETEVFARVFRQPPRVAVPPTFVWNDAVETAWMAAGIGVIITPGRRYTGRDAEGKPAGVDGAILNGETAGPMALYLVRDIYFEPLRGHVPQAVLAQARHHFRLGRPALLETHRSNFVGTETEFSQSLACLDGLLNRARADHPALCFLSPEALGGIYRAQPLEHCVQDPRARLQVWLRRLSALPRLRKLAWLSGLALPLALLWWLTRPAARREGLPT